MVQSNIRYAARMVRRVKAAGPSPAAALAPGASWLDEAPTFHTPGDLLLAEVLADVHRTARLLARRRAELKLSQTQVATWAGVGRQTVAAIEDGTTWPDQLTVMRVASALGVTIRADVIPGRPIGPRAPSRLYRGR